MDNNCAALCLESVARAGTHGYEFYKSCAKNYNMYMIEQNAVEFGLPQWRKRVWIMFHHKI